MQINKALIVFLILLFVCADGSVVQASFSTEALDESNGSWVSMKNSVHRAIDNVDVVNGLFSYRFSAENATGWMNFGFEAVAPLNLSGRFLILWLKIQNVTLETPLTLTLDDVNGTKRGFGNVVSWFALKQNTWARVVLDMSNFQWEDVGFDAKRVIRLRFVTYNGGKPYSQVIWIEDPAVLLEEDNQNSTSNYVGNNVDFSLISNILFLFSVFCCTGFIVVHFLKPALPSDWNFSVALPFYTTIGLATFVVLLSLFCMVYFDVIICWCILIAVFAAFSILIMKDWANIRIGIKNMRRIEFIFPICLLSFSLFIFLRLALDIGWGAYVDSQTHGLFTSLILFYKSFPSTSYPVGNIILSQIRYPMGFHALSAFDSLLTGVLPGQAILIIATILVSFLPSLFYSIIYLYSKSYKLSMVAFLLIFFLPGSTPLLWRSSHDLLLGNFLVGIYPNLLGNVITITFLAIIVLFNIISNRSWRKSFFVYVLLIASLCFSYYALLPFFVAFILLKYYALYFKKPKLTPKNCFGIAILLLISILIIFTILFYKELIINFLKIDNLMLYAIYMRYTLFELNSPYLIYALFILAAFPFSLWFLSRNNLRDIGLLFLAFFLPLMAAQNKQIYVDFLWFIQPDRVLILLVVFSYVVVLLGVAEFSRLKWKHRRLHILVRIGRNKHNLGLSWLLVGFVILLCIPSLVSYVTYSYPVQYKRDLPNGNDFRALAWLTENATSSGLILNDRTVMGLWASSFKAMEIVNDREIILRLFLFGSLNDTLLANRTYEVNEILDYPWDYNGIQKIAQKYNVSYIYITDDNSKLYERGQSIAPFPWSHLSQKERILMYLQNPDLEVVFRSGNAVIFKIKK
jgi:hypothetical protein